MKLFAWTVFFRNPIPETLPDLDIDMLPISKNGLYIMWGLGDKQTLESILSSLASALWVLSYTDISSEENEQLEIMIDELESWVFESVSFEWPEIGFDVVLERFSESDEVLCVREAEASHKFGNKVIRVDFMY